MKMFFSGSISGGLDDVALYLEIIKLLQSYGDVISEHTVGADGRAHYDSEDITPQEAHDRDVDWVLSSDVVVAEVSTPSIGVGYEIGRAVAARVPVIALYRTNSSKTLSAMIEGAPADVMTVIKYSTIEELADKLPKHLSSH